MKSSSIYLEKFEVFVKGEKGQKPTVGKKVAILRLHYEEKMAEKHWQSYQASHDFQLVIH